MRARGGRSNTTPNSILLRCPVTPCKTQSRSKQPRAFKCCQETRRPARARPAPFRDAHILHMCIRRPHFRATHYYITRPFESNLESTLVKLLRKKLMQLTHAASFLLWAGTPSVRRQELYKLQPYQI